MLRHSRDMIRHHRERWKKRRLHTLGTIWGSREWAKEIYPTLSKWSAHHHKCDMCEPRYNRAKEKAKFRREMNGP